MEFSPVSLISMMTRRGVELSVVDGDVYYRVPPGLPEPPITKWLATFHADVVALLGEPAAWRRAPRERWCAAYCAAAERGERVQLCSRCDEPLEAS